MACDKRVIVISGDLGYFAPAVQRQPVDSRQDPRLVPRRDETIGVFPYVWRLMLDDKKYDLHAEASRAPTDGNFKYIEGRFAVAIPSGFTVSAIAASFWPHCTSACLVGLGTVGGNSPTILNRLELMTLGLRQAADKDAAENERAARRHRADKTTDE